MFFRNGNYQVKIMFFCKLFNTAFNICILNKIIFGIQVLQQGM